MKGREKKAKGREKVSPDKKTSYIEEVNNRVCNALLQIHNDSENICSSVKTECGSPRFARPQVQPGRIL